ncbi:hypothetical protein [Stackebrandtia soli]|uniref:hypothetical protein n=1 Tax=Stackebrandtia soli TaxID=1892856 RepID=UPI0039EB862C
MGNAQTSQQSYPAPPPTGGVTAVVPPQAVPTDPVVHGGPPQGHGPLLAATSGAVAGLRPVQDLRMRRLMGVSAWALALASCGLLLGTIALLRMMAEVPAWFQPAFIGTGIFGLVLAIAAFLTVQFQRVPFLLLGASTVTLVIGIILLGQL